MSFENYIQAIRQDYIASGSSEYYIPPRCDDDLDLHSVVLSWISSESKTPIVIVGGYGQGKSTFAKHVAEQLASQSASNPTSRIPILIPLGDIYDEQSIDGLIGKALASTHRVSGYHFHLFSELNRLGHFVIIFDGFDEMKHGMTPLIFMSNFERLLSLNEGRAKLIFLGRDTVFHDELEFKSIIEGKELTRGGQFVPIHGKTRCEPHFLKGFNVEEAREFVSKYFPIAASEAAKSNVENQFEIDWVNDRLGKLLDGTFDQLLERPVHAQMLCQVATQPDLDLSNLSRFYLFDRFIHFLLRRELSKSGRFQGFSTEVRRRFNSTLAWWLWEQGGLSTASLSSIPDKLFRDAVGSAPHPFSPVALRRELVAGCLAIKDQQSVYFGHRSIQEFLVSEHLFETGLLEEAIQGSAPQALRRVLRTLNPEIISFLIGWVTNSKNVNQIAQSWFDLLAGTTARGIPLNGLELFVQLFKVTSRPIRISGGWAVLMPYFSRVGAAQFAIPKDMRKWAEADLKSRLFSEARGSVSDKLEHESSAAAALLFWCSSCEVLARKGDARRLVEFVIACLVSRPSISMFLRILKESTTATIKLESSDDFIDILLLKSLQLRGLDDGNRTVDLSQIIDMCVERLNISFEREAEFRRSMHSVFKVNIDRIAKIVLQLKNNEASLEAKLFLTDYGLRRRIFFPKT